MEKEFDVIVIGAGISGLTAAALLAKRGLSVAVLERNIQPGGSCSAFRRNGFTFDLGAAMLFGFGERGYNPHRFVMNEIEEALDVYCHEAMYRLHFGDHKVIFWPEKEHFFAELHRLFPNSIGDLEQLYRHLEELYDAIITSNSAFLSPTETPQRELLANLLKHPLSQFRLLRLLRKSAKDLMHRWVKDPAICRFFNKLTSTYTYTTIDETPALLVATMFVENHVGRSYYPAGSPMMLAAKLEKAIEKFGGVMRYEETVTRILVADGRASGVETASGNRIMARDIIFSGTVWNLYRQLLPREIMPKGLLEKVEALIPTFPSSVLVGVVDASAVPPDAHPVEMFVGNPDAIDESDVTLYLSSIEDPSLTQPGAHVFMLVGPSATPWPSPWSEDYQSRTYREMKDAETERMLALVERYFPGFRTGVHFSELGSPATVERYLLKNWGAVAGPKQCMGQELLHRQPATTFLPGLFACGESTVMGTGTPAVTISGISAADVVLRSRGMPEYRNRPAKKQYVRIIPRGERGNLPRSPVFYPAALCQWCEGAPCARVCPAGIDIRGILRRLEADNIEGARKRLQETSVSPSACAHCEGRPCLVACTRNGFDNAPVPIPNLLIASETAL
ncbi:MAG: FAD-dependent oxidoreductase [Anaerolineae bacterium]|nr:FAD-dependent oxidoreductase [Anaerolineae bacterium]